MDSPAEPRALGAEPNAARLRRAVALAAAACLISVGLGCATPVGVNPASQREVDEQLSGNVLTSGKPSSLSSEYLERLALGDLYESTPREALEKLRSGLGGPDERSRLFALAELWFGAAQKSGDRSEYLASAVCAYAYLFPSDTSSAGPLYDGTLRLALDLYNRGITEGLRNGDTEEVDLSARTLPLPFGTFALETPEKAFHYGGYLSTHPVSLVDEKVRGLRNRYRRAGVGAALVARVELPPNSVADPWLPGNAKVPITAFVRIHDAAASIAHGAVQGTLELYDADDVPAIQIGQRTVPLESEPSAALAYRLEGAPVWDFEIAGFRRTDLRIAGTEKNKGLFFLNPYRRGRIPVVFVHGTASSPARWAEMANELLGDPRIASHFQLWFFIYNSGQPVLLSASNLREGLRTAVHDVDPDGTDPALREMVVIGHSQGGLLTKLMVVSSDNVFWANLSDVPFESVELDDSDLKEQVRQALFFEPLPFVKRVVFISTPHKGSYLAENWLGMLARRLVNTPAALTHLSLEVARLRAAHVLRSKWKPATSIDNMDWSNPQLRSLHELPIAPGVHAHSIIPVKSPPLETGEDGVVRYESAHIEPVESELVVMPASHSVQSNPQAIEEVRRILYEHAGIH